MKAYQGFRVGGSLGIRGVGSIHKQYWFGPKSYTTSMTMRYMCAFIAVAAVIAMSSSFHGYGNFTSAAPRLLLLRLLLLNYRDDDDNHSDC